MSQIQCEICHVKTRRIGCEKRLFMAKFPLDEDRFQSLLGRTTTPDNSAEEVQMLSTRASTVVSDDSFITPVSSVDDLMALSPKMSNDLEEQTDVTRDFLTGADFDSIYNVTMQEVPQYDDMFIDATSLDYLVKCGGSNCNQNLVDRANESLFVKFDPLYARKFGSTSTNAESVGDSAEADGGYETESAISISIDATTSSLSTGSINSTFIKEKPMHVVPTVVNSEATKASSSQPRKLLRILSAILTPTQVRTGKLINIAGSTPPVAAPRSPGFQDKLQALRHILLKQEQEVFQLRQQNRELKSLFQDGEHQRKIECLEAKIKKLTEENENMVDRENKLVDETIENKKVLSTVIEECEKTISCLIGKQQRENVGSMELVERLTIERDQAWTHLTSLEFSFHDLISKYERAKSVILETKDREKIFEQKLAEYEAGMQKYGSLYNSLKQETEEKLNNANKTLDNIKKKHNEEITKHEITIVSLKKKMTQAWLNKPIQILTHPKKL